MRSTALSCVAFMLAVATGCELVAGISDRSLDGTASGGQGPGAGGAGPGGSGAATSGGQGPGGGPGGGGSGTGGTGATSCPGPTLIVGVENLDAEEPGYAIQLSLAGGETATRCDDITDPRIPQQPFALAWMGDDGLALASGDEVALVGGSGSGWQWQDSNWPGAMPLDVFPLTDPDGAQLVAVAWTAAGLTDVREIIAYDVTDGAEVRSWALNSSDIPLGLGWAGMTASPLEPSHFFALKDGDPALREVGPFDDFLGAPVASAAYLRTIFAHGAGTVRVAWTGGASVTADSVYYRVGDGSVTGPIGCADSLDCLFQHAVPDPTASDRYLALCGHNENVDVEVVRLVAGGGTDQSCPVLFSGGELSGADRQRLSRMTIAP